MGLTPTDEQKVAIDMFARFVTSRDDHAVMLMKGSAGTGKTTLASAMVRAMAETKQKIVLLAPTGRAAKGFAVNSRQPAYTIHRKIYRQRSGAIGMEGFSLNDNLHTDTLFVIDEASMIANQGWNDSGFGSGHLLDDLVRYVYGGRN